MKETYYFAHDYNATQDPKMMQLLSQCGLEGIALYWILIEILHQQPSSSISKESYIGYIEMYGRKDGENEHLLNKIEQMLITCNLLVEEDGIIYSKRVLENKKQRQIISEKRSLAGKKSAEIRQKSTSVEQVLNKCATKSNIIKERKGKERKGNINNITSELSSQIKQVMDIFYKINPTINWGNKTTRKACEDLIKRFGLEDTIKMADKIVSIQGKQYAPVCTTPHQMKEKLAQFKIYFDSQKNNKPKVAIIS